MSLKVGCIPYADAIIQHGRTMFRWWSKSLLESDTKIRALSLVKFFGLSIDWSWKRDLKMMTSTLVQQFSTWTSTESKQFWTSTSSESRQFWTTTSTETNNFESSTNFNQKFKFLHFYILFSYPVFYSTLKTSNIIRNSSTHQLQSEASISQTFFSSSTGMRGSHWLT